MCIETLFRKVQERNKGEDDGASDYGNQAEPT